MAALTFDEFDNASTPSGALTFDEFSAPVKKYNIGKSGLADAAREIMANQGWMGRNYGAMGLQLSKAYEGLTGADKNDPNVTVANVAAEEAPIGAFVGDVAKYAPAALAATAASPVLLPALAAGAIGFGTTPGDVGERAQAGAIDAGAGYGAGKLVQGAAWAAKRIGNKMSSLSSSRKAAGDVIGEANVPAATRILDAAPDTISAEQALVGMGNPNVANLAKITRGLSPQMAEEYAQIQTRQAAGREAAMRGVTPDLNSAVATREAASGPLYQQADTAVAQLDAPFMDLFNRLPKGTMEAAADIARMDGKTFMRGKYEPAHSIETGMLDSAGAPIMRQVPAVYPQMTGESLHYIKRALSDISNAVDPARGIGRDSQAAARGVLEDFLPAFENKIPVYGNARTTFAAASAPVNQSKVLTAMTNKLQSATGKESPASFLNTMGTGEQAMLKKSTGFPRYKNLSEVLNPRQMGVVDDVAGQLQREATLAQNRASDGSRQAVINAVKQDSWITRIPNFLSRPAMIVNAVTGELEAKANAAMMAKLATAMDNPKALSALLKTLPIEQRNLAVKMINQISPTKAVVHAATLSDLMQQ